MIALWIIGVLLALIVLLCWNRVGVHAVFGDELLLDARIGVFHIHILPGKEPDKEKKKREKKETDDTENTEETEKKPGLSKPSTEDIRDAVSTLWPPLKRAL